MIRIAKNNLGLNSAIVLRAAINEEDTRSVPSLPKSPDGRSTYLRHNVREQQKPGVQAASR
jgi:hypothetical protein